MSKGANTYRTSDADIILWTSTSEDWNTYKAVMKCLGENGFVIQRQPDIDKCIRKYFHHAQKQDLQAQLRIYPAGMSIKFYQDVVHENPYGGFYDFNKLKKMPYQIRLSFELTKKKLLGLLDSLSFVCENEHIPADQFERAQCTYFRREYPTPTTEKDMDGAVLQDGLMRWTRTYDGRLFRGLIYWDGNNMWNVVANSKLRYRCASFQLFTYDASIHPKKLHAARKQRQQKLLKQAVEAQDFERAIIFRDLLAKEGEE